MIEVDKYMNDGANWQAQCVLAFVRANKELAIESSWNNEFHHYDAEILVGRYENCREQGYILSIRDKLGKTRHYAIYEHRNSDDLCVVVFDKQTINTPTLNDVCEAMGDNKYNYTKSFPCGLIEDCGNYIIYDMKEFLDSKKK